MFNNPSNLRSEDRIKDIYEHILELKSLMSIMQSAAYNEFSPPETEDIDKAFCVMVNYIDNIVISMKDFMNYCQEHQLYD